MNSNYRKNSGFTLIELVLAMSLSLIMILGVSSILVSGVTSFDKLWNYINKEVSVDSDVFTITFGAIGRKSNRTEYKLYTVNNGTFTEALPDPFGLPEQIVRGDAVEFVYWDVPLNASDSYGLMDITKKGTASALFYVAGGELRVDYNHYPSLAIPTGGGSRKTPDRTEVLVRNINWVEFSHSTVNEQGQGCVRATLHIKDEYGKNTAILKSAVYPRNKWPR